MRLVRPLRIAALSFCLALAACGGSSVNGGGDGASGADGGVTDGAAGKDGGHAGSGGKDGGGADTTGAGGAGKDGGSDAADASDAALDTATADGAAADAEPVDASDALAASDVCAAFTINAPAAVVANMNNGKTVDPTGFSGGALESGTYWLTSVTHFGGTYAGPTQEIWVVDATAKTLEDASLVGATSTYTGVSLSNKSAAVLSGAPVCGGAVASTWNYTVIGKGAGAKISVNPQGSSDVKIFTKQ